MTDFQLDENFDYKILVTQCNAEGKCTVVRFPKSLKGTADSHWLPDLLTRKSPLLTKDFRIIEQNRSHIPRETGGVIIARPKRPQPSFTAEMAKSIIANFKERFPDWPTTDWSNTYVEINEVEVYVSHLHPDKLDDGETVPFNLQDFRSRLDSALDKARKTPKLQSQ